MKKVIAILAFCPALVIGSPTDSLQILQEQVSEMNGQITRLQQENRKLVDINNQQGRDIEALQLAMQQQSESVDSIANVVLSNFKTTETAIKKNQQGTEGQLQALSSSIKSKTILGLAGFLISVILLCLVYYLLKKRISHESSTLSKIKSAQESLEKAQKAMQEESVKLDSKLVELLEKQVSAKAQKTGNESVDHTLALKVAGEIVRIETNLFRMDASVRGYIQLKHAVRRIRDNFMANGYEIVEMLGKPYNEGMKLENADFVFDETLDEGEQKITGIKKPQVNYNGRMIQAAWITVSQNL